LVTRGDLNEVQLEDEAVGVGVEIVGHGTELVEDQIDAGGAGAHRHRRGRRSLPSTAHAAAVHIGHGADAHGAAGDGTGRVEKGIGHVGVAGVAGIAAELAREGPWRSRTLCLAKSHPRPNRKIGADWPHK
jgi:hypothetical protein